jgi:hypothetical protein
MSGAVAVAQAALVAALEAHPTLPTLVTGIYDGPPPRAAYPYLVVSDSVSIDWSTKTARGREVSLIVTLWDERGGPHTMHDIMSAIEDAVQAMPRDLPGWRIATLNFVRSRILRTNAGPWSGLVEHRVRVLETI